MTEAQARQTANILIGAAAIGAACVIVRTPALRRLAWQLVRTAIGTTGPVWLMNEVRHAWNDGRHLAVPPASGEAPEHRPHAI
jgi:hypothetical protein